MLGCLGQPVYLLCGLWIMKWMCVLWYARWFNSEGRRDCTCCVGRAKKPFVGVQGVQSVEE